MPDRTGRNSWWTELNRWEAFAMMAVDGSDNPAPGLPRKMASAHGVAFRADANRNPLFNLNPCSTSTC